MLECSILTTQQDIQALSKDWQALFAQCGDNPFSDFPLFWAWWKTVAPLKKTSLHVVIGRKEGRLTAVLPLVVCVKRGFRGLFWAGYDVFFGNMGISEDPNDLEYLWRAAYQSPLYDVAEIKYVVPDSVAHKTFKTFKNAKVLADDVVTSIRLEGMDAQAWRQNLSSKMRAEFRRKEKKLSQNGVVSLVVYTKQIPAAIVQEMARHKAAWCKEKNRRNAIFDSPDFLKSLIDVGEKKGKLVLMCLLLDEKPVGFNLSFVVGRKIYGYMLAYDLVYASSSVGSILAYHSVRWAADHGYVEFNLMEGREPYKRRFNSHVQQIQTYIFYRTFKGYIGKLLLILRQRKIRRQHA